MTARQVPNKSTNQVPNQVPNQAPSELCRFGHACLYKNLQPTNRNFCNRFHELECHCINGPNCEFRFELHSQHPCRFSHDFNAAIEKFQFEKVPRNKHQAVTIDVNKNTVLKQKIAQQEEVNLQLKLQMLQLEQKELHEKIRILQKQQMQNDGGFKPQLR